jgi:RNA polymerase-binding transcription factor DksA
MHYHYFTLEQRDALSRQILETKPAALDQLRSPEYGVCEVCGGDIAFVQLLANPLRKTCRHCET